MSNNGYNRNYNRNYRSSYNRNASQRRRNTKRRNRRRLRNRIIIVSTFIILIALIILVFSLLFKSCFGGSQDATQPMATETIAPSTETQKPTSNTSSNSAVDLSDFSVPNPKDDNSSATLEGDVLMWNNAVFELFKGTEDTATNYAETINNFAANAGSNLKVYSMVVPNHTEMGLPERLKSGDGYSTESQAANIKTIYSKFSSNVTAVNCYNNLAEHCNEYIYFNTDHHWTALGSYYAYKAFAKSTNQEVLSLDQCTENKIEGFTGSFTNIVSGNIGTDTVSYWTFPYETSMELTTETGGEALHCDSVYYEDETSGSNSYGVFIYGDNPLSVLKSDRQTGKKIAVVKESYGNAFVPYLTYNYDEVHVIDFRHWEGSLASYCSENGIDEVLFINGIMSANTGMQNKALISIM